MSSAAAATERAVDLLRAHVDEVGFVGFHKYLVSPDLYSVNPNLIRGRERSTLADMDRYVSGDLADLRLGLCLMADVALPMNEVPAHQHGLRDALIAARMLLPVDGQLRMGRFQLISFRDMPLLVDHRLNFSTDMHDVYIGPDSLLLTYYLDDGRIGPHDRVLDLGTGTGALALYLARFSDCAVATDIMAAPLQLAALNRRLNGAEDRLEIRREDYIATIDRGERYRVVTFNPPFIPYPDGLDGPAFAQGIGRDGLDYCRMLIELFDNLVEPDGVAYIVADMVGDASGPFFLGDLATYAKTMNLVIDVYVDARVDLREEEDRHLSILATSLERENPDVDPNELRKRVDVLHLRELGADFTWCAVMVIRRSEWIPGRVTTFNRMTAEP